MMQAMVAQMMMFVGRRMQANAAAAREACNLQLGNPGDVMGAALSAGVVDSTFLPSKKSLSLGTG